MVGKPNRGSHAGGCLLPNVLREDRSAIALLGENHTTRKSRYAHANNCDVSRHSQMVGTDRRAVRKNCLNSGASGGRALPRSRYVRNRVAASTIGATWFRSIEMLSQKKSWRALGFPQMRHWNYIDRRWKNWRRWRMRGAIWQKPKVTA